jgi:hypothetical protein
MLARPSRRATPSMPMTWSKGPWLNTTASNVSGAMPSRSRLPISPSGVMPASNSTRDAAVDGGFDQRGESVFGAEEVDAVAVDGHAVGDDR